MQINGTTPNHQKTQLIIPNPIRWVIRYSHFEIERFLNKFLFEKFDKDHQ